MNDEFEQLVKQLQHMQVELPVHKDSLRRQLLTLHATHNNGRQRPFYARSRVRAMMTSGRILPVGVVVLLGVVILGWLWLSSDSNGQSDQRQLAGQTGQPDTQNKRATSPRDNYQSTDGLQQKHNNQSESSGQPSAALTQASGPVATTTINRALNTGVITDAIEPQSPSKPADDIDLVVAVDTKADKAADKAEAKAAAKAEKAVAKAEAKAEKLAEKAQKKLEKLD